MRGRGSVGGWITARPDEEFVAYSSSGADFVAIDCQHSILDEADAAAALLSSNALLCPVYVRVSRNDGALIGRVADAGADGVIVPAVESSKEAAIAVSACVYPPRGNRSYGPFSRDLPSDPELLASRVSVHPMIETAEGFQSAAEICRTPGVAGVYVGPADLALALGLDPASGLQSERLRDALAEIVCHCRSARIQAGIHAADPASVGDLWELGFDLITLGDGSAAYASSRAAGAQREQ